MQQSNFKVEYCLIQQYIWRNAGDWKKMMLFQKEFHPIVSVIAESRPSTPQTRVQ